MRKNTRGKNSPVLEGHTNVRCYLVSGGHNGIAKPSPCRTSSTGGRSSCILLSHMYVYIIQKLASPVYEVVYSVLVAHSQKFLPKSGLELINFAFSPLGCLAPSSSLIFGKPSSSSSPAPAQPRGTQLRSRNLVAGTRELEIEKE